MYHAANNNIITFTVFRLLMAEKSGHLCRDDHIEGLQFYPNLFNSKSPVKLYLKN